MGFNKRYLIFENTLLALKKNNLKNYIGKSDVLIFDDQLTSMIYDLFKEGKKDEEILSIINQKLEENKNEMY